MARPAAGQSEIAIRTARQRGGSALGKSGQGRHEGGIGGEVVHAAGQRRVHHVARGALGRLVDLPSLDSHVSAGEQRPPRFGPVLDYGELAVARGNDRDTPHGVERRSSWPGRRDGRRTSPHRHDGMNEQHGGDDSQLHQASHSNY
jgi:hypothetical protein